MHTEEPCRIIESEAQSSSERLGRSATRSTQTAPVRSGLARRTLQLALLVICAALLIATAAEAWVRHGIEQQVTAAQARNAGLQRDINATRRSITIAELPATIEREARAWGYIRAGDHPIIVVAGG